MVQRDIVCLGNLSELAFLGLWENSYKGERLRFHNRTFPKLKFLGIDGLDTIRWVTITKGVIPELELDLWRK
jgi:hypothetical protein